MNAVNQQLLDANRRRLELLEEQRALEERRRTAGAVGPGAELPEVPPAAAPAAAPATTTLGEVFGPPRAPQIPVRMVREAREGQIAGLGLVPTAEDFQAADAAAQRFLVTNEEIAGVVASNLDLFSALGNEGLKGLLDALGQIPLRLADAVAQAAILRALAAGLGGAGGGFFPVAATPARHGMVLRKMATGGFITKRPTLIPMATGAAMVSEYGQSEAVMPLKRMASGDLGVAFEGGPGGGNTINIDARQSTPGTTAAAVAAAVRLAPGAVVNAQARGMAGRGRAPF